ncbi:MAG: sugar ABC transporter ATP-binding protein [Phycisphaerales bacterium JB039]
MPPDADSPANAPLVEMVGVHKSFGAQEVLSGVDFTIRPGEAHVLAGENGAGKTTLIRILGGALRADAGEVRIGGRPIRLHSVQDAAAAGVAVIHQELSLCPSLSVADNLALGREPVTRLGWIRRRETAARARAALARVGLDMDLQTPVGALPLAARQLVEIAKALALDARVVVMDEPTSSLARPDVERLFALIEEITQADPPAGVVFISHRLEEIERIADRITVLRDGKLALSAAADDCPPDALIGAMVGRSLQEQTPRRSVAPGRTLLEAHDLTVRPRTGRGVRGVSLDVRAGEIVGLAGLRGCGAGDILHALFGDRSGVSGRIMVDGARARLDSPRAAVRARLALVTGDRQALGVCPQLSVMENITLASLDRVTRLGLVRDRLAAQCARAAARALAIRCRSIGQPVGRLSGGNQQKVVLGRWMQTEPLVMLLDDPTRGVDIGARQEIYGLLNAWTARGIGVLLASTDLPELIAMSDRIIVLHRGRITARLGRDEATPPRIMAAALGETREAA